MRDDSGAVCSRLVCGFTSRMRTMQPLLATSSRPWVSMYLFLRDPISLTYARLNIRTLGLPWTQLCVSLALVNSIVGESVCMPLSTEADLEGHDATSTYPYIRPCLCVIHLDESRQPEFTSDMGTSGNRHRQLTPGGFSDVAATISASSLFQNGATRTLKTCWRTYCLSWTSQWACESVLMPLRRGIRW